MLFLIDVPQHVKLQNKSLLKSSRAFFSLEIVTIGWIEGLVYNNFIDRVLDVLEFRDWIRICPIIWGLKMELTQLIMKPMIINKINVKMTM